MGISADATALLTAGAAAVAGAVRRGDVSAREAVDACLARIDAVNPRINAVVARDDATALRHADAADTALARGEPVGPLHGVPLTVKDCFSTAGLPATAGTAGRASFVPDADDPVVARLRAAGAIVVGKTNCPELLLGFESDNDVYGRTANPYDLTRTPGGSSGGEAAIVAAGASPLGLGSDSGGSIRVPAHFCGVAGLKATQGRIPTTSTAYATVGVMARLRSVGFLAPTVADLALALPVVAGPDGADPYAVPAPLGDAEAVPVELLRVAWHVDGGMEPASEVAAAVRDAAAALAAAGAHTVEARPPGVEEAARLFTGVVGADGGDQVRAALGLLGTDRPSPLVAAMLGQVGVMRRSGSELVALLREWDLLRAGMLAFLRDHDVVVCPVGAVPAPRHGETPGLLAAFTHCWMHSLTGLPVVTVRAGTSAGGLPVGVQVVAGPWREDVALAAAATVERALGPFPGPAV